MVKEKMIVCIDEEKKIETIQTLIEANKDIMILTSNPTIFHTIRELAYKRIVLYEKISSLAQYDFTTITKVIVVSDELKTIEKFCRMTKLFTYAPIMAVVKQNIYPDAMYTYLGVNFVVHYKTKIMADLVE